MFETFQERADVLDRRLVLVGIVAGASAIGGCAAAPQPAARSGQPTFYRNLAEAGARVDEAAAASMFSGFRSNQGRGPLTVDPALMRVAQAQAEAMAAANEVGVRTGPLSTRLQSIGYAHRAAHETTSAGYLTLAEAFSGWRDSSPHRAAILDARMTRMGIATGFRPGSKYRVFWALVVAQPAGLA